ncbi:MAG: glycoside hydrolase family 127 protein [Jiangellaceae bacterium]
MRDRRRPPEEEGARTVPADVRPVNERGGRPVVPTIGRLRPLGLGEVTLVGGFWGERQEVNSSATLDHCLTWMERVGWIDNFRASMDGRLPEQRRGREFSDSDVYKLIEAMAWEVGRSGSTAADAAIGKLAATIAPVQEEDGYLNTAFGRPGQPRRYSDLEAGHELYCYGFLIQAGVARARVSGRDDLVDLARRSADHVCEVFGPDANQGICGHPEIEMALVELARLTGEQRYLDQASLFVERRGRQSLADIEFGRSYFQDDVPVRDATVFRGHAVRALYLASGAVDVAVETGDDRLLDAVARQWAATVARRTYITGGMGAQHADEAFGDDFVLPPDRAYSETCAGVASVMLSWRLLLATGDPRYADLIERTLYNVVAAATAPDGRAFFYANTLHQRRPGAVPAVEEPSQRAESSLRAPWFAVSCCPTNVARTLASLAAYVATADEAGVQVHQFADADVHTVLDDGRAIGLQMRTAYPDDGSVTLQVVNAPAGVATISLRVPTWAGGQASLVDPDGSTRVVPSGYVGLTRSFVTGDEIRLDLPMAPRWTMADPRIDAVRDAVAVERGPLVYCVESTDLPDGGDVEAVRVDPAINPTERGGRVVVAGAMAEPTDAPWPYGDRRPPGRKVPLHVDIPLLPYHAWANRGPSTMRVWMPRTEEPR